MSLLLALAACFLSGFVALSYEILWFRAYSLCWRGTPGTFGVLLGFYLLGLALGSLASRALCKDREATFDPAKLLTLSGLALAGNAVSFLVIPGLGWLASLGHVWWLLSLAQVCGGAGLLGAMLPLISHFAIAPDDRAGARLSYLYVLNILGSAVGSLVTGFVLMDVMTLPRLATLLFFLQLLLSTGLLFSARLSERRMLAAGLGLALLQAAVLAAVPTLFDGLYEKLQYRRDYTPANHFAHVIENRHGVINVTRDGQVFGGGVYDGVFSTSLVNDRNGIKRAYAVAAFHAQPRQVLMIGLASGSWAQVVAHLPGLEHLTIVEINPGYLELIRLFPEVRSLLANPKVDIVIDDGRRWMQRHPDQRFDVIVQNTTYHNRAHSTNLLSREYLELSRQHLALGGILYYNTTYSLDAMRTAATLFPHALRFDNFMIVSDSPFEFDGRRWRQALEGYRIDGQPVFDLSSAEHRRQLESVLYSAETLHMPVSEKAGLESRESLLRRTADSTIITDDNMVCEWRSFSLGGWRHLLW